jgi:two-component system cell cycle response regulator
MAKTILVVDDEVDYLKAFLRLFTRAGYEVLTAVNAIEAVQKAHAHLPDIVVLDVHMPGGSGGDVYDLLAMSSQTSGTPVIFVSGKDYDELRLDLSFVKREQFFSKPIDETLLLERIRILLSTNRK